MALGLTSPVSRLSLRYRLIVARETSNVLMISARGFP
jgi:hypothetical protein